MNRTILTVIVVILLIVGGAVALSHKSNNNSPSYSSGANNKSSSTSTPNKTQTSTSGGTIDIKNMMFTPPQITIKEGESVTWTNNDSVAHTVTADLEHGPKSDLIQPGGTFTYTFTDKGSFQYHCSIHPSMRGTIVVQS